MAFLASFIQYVVIFIILVAVAGLGIFVGRLLRKRKDAKEAAAVAAKAVSVEGETTNE